MTIHNETEAQRLREERDYWKRQYEEVYDAGHNFSVIAAVKESERNEAVALRDQAIRERDQARIAACALYSDNAPGTHAENCRDCCSKYGWDFDALFLEKS